MKEVAEIAILKTQNTEISTSMWVEARFMMAKSYLSFSKTRKAIAILHDICYILPLFPLPGLSYTEQVLESRGEGLQPLEAADDEEEAKEIFDQAFFSFNNRKSIVLKAAGDPQRESH